MVLMSSYSAEYSKQEGIHTTSYSPGSKHQGTTVCLEVSQVTARIRRTDARSLCDGGGSLRPLMKVAQGAACYRNVELLTSL